MRCPACLKPDSKVVDSRIAEDGLEIRRRRECIKCGWRFSTLEGIELLNLTVIKRDGERQPYDREKLERSMKLALGKRPFKAEGFKKLVSLVERDIQRRRSDEVTSREIGDIVMKHLQKFDQIGYIRFASLYRQFADVSAFQKEIKSLMPTEKSTRRKVSKKK
jgi:transcriptional repressor NrdR